ncbi:MAG: choice-of-anchor Q domain-containing protein [bacterium]
MNRNAWSSFRSFAGIVRRLLPGLAVMLMAGTGQANIINLTHPYTNTTIAAVIANAATVDGDVILVNTNVQTENGIVVSKGVTLMGLGQNTTIVQGATARSNATDRIFNVLAGGGAGIWKSFTLSNMTIRYGYTTNDGAGLQVDYNNSPYWTTTVDRVTFTMNDQHAGIGSGGGAIVQNKWPSILIIRNSSFSSNTTSKAGGAIYLRGMGGMEISGSTFAQNQAASGGGGLYMDYVTSGMTTIKNSTFAYNSTPGSTGGGIYFGGRSAFTGAVYNCTFYSNSATYGGGIFIENDIGTPGTVRLTSCLLASNSAPTAPELYIRSGVPTTISNCLAQGGIGGTGTYTDGGGNQTNVNAKVLPLADNGGPTLTCAIASDSPARDAGSNPLSLAADQRGTGFTRTRGTVTDIGAFEYGASAVTYPGTFIEVYPFNSGAINNTANLLITIVGGETFTGTDCSQITNNVVVTNLPAGLTLSMIRTNNGTAALVALLGNAAQQAQSNTVTNLGFTFLDAAFTLGNASQLGSYSVTNQTVQFYDAVAGGALAYGARTSWRTPPGTMAVSPRRTRSP